MKLIQVIFSVVLITNSLNTKAQEIFFETFDEGEGLTTGSDDIGGIGWNTTCAGCLDGADFFKINAGKMTGQDTNGPAAWTTEEIDISSCPQVSISFDLSEEGTMEACGTGCNSADWVRFQYNIDGMGWMDPEDAMFCAGACAGLPVIQSDDIAGGARVYSLNCLAGGETIQLRITVQAWAASERWRIDNVRISCAEGPEVDAGEDLTICSGTPVTLEADNPEDAILEWNNDVVDGESFTPGPGSEEYIVSASLDGCESKDTVVVTVIPTASVSISPAGPFSTTDDPVFLMATPPGGAWSATCGSCINEETGEFNPEVAGEGTWEVCYEAGISPCDDSDCISIIVESGECQMEGSITVNPPTCFGYSDGSATVFMTETTGDVTFVITNEIGEVINVENSNTANSLSEGWYYFTVTDEFPCLYINSVFIDDPDQMEVDLEISNPLCYGEETGSAIVSSIENYTGEFENIDYIWSPNPNGDNGTGEDTLFSAPAGDYNLNINDENGCTISIDFELIDPDSLYVNNIGAKPAYCRMFGYQKGKGVVFADAAGGTPDYEYLWENLETGETWVNTTWGGLNPGNYKITVVDDNGCEASKEIKVDSLNPIADFDMFSDQFTTQWEGTAPVEVLFENQSSQFSNPEDPLADTAFFWSFGLEGEVFSDNYYENFERTYEEEGTYEVCLVALNNNGCSDTMCREIIVYDPFAFIPPNIFSPNGDGINDTFTFGILAKSVNTFNCVIVNRWGEVIFEMNSISEEWIGENKSGIDAATGVYFYKYAGESDSGDAFSGQGTIQLVR